MHLILSQLRVRVPLVGRARLLRDDAFAALLADRVEHLLARADDMVAVEDRRRHAFEQRREPLLALDVGQLADVLAAVDQQVEGVESEVGALALLQRRLEQLEARLALVVERDRLAVDQAAGGKLRRGLDQRLELVAPVLAVAGPGGGDAVADREQQPIAVIFDIRGASCCRSGTSSTSVASCGSSNGGGAFARRFLRAPALLARRGWSATRPRPPRSPPSSGRS